MGASLEVEVAWLRSLSSRDRARFLAWLSHNLTIAARVLKHTPESAETRLEQLYEISEIQHRVSSYIGHALGTDEDSGWLLGVTARVLEPSDPTVRRETANAWALTRKSFVSAA